MVFRTLNHGKSDFEQKMKQAKREYEPKFWYGPGQDIASGQFIKERIQLLYDRHIPIVHLLMRNRLTVPYFDVNTIARFNKTLIDYCVKNYPDRIRELNIYGHHHGDFPGTEVSTIM